MRDHSGVGMTAVGTGDIRGGGVGETGRVEGKNLPMSPEGINVF